MLFFQIKTKYKLFNYKEALLTWIQFRFCSVNCITKSKQLKKYEDVAKTLVIAHLLSGI
jgi:hypothetical protein